MTLWIAQLRAALLGLLVGAGIVGGMLLMRRPDTPAPVPIHIGYTQPQPERDLSPKGAPRSVLVARVQPGTPASPPVQPPPDVAPAAKGPASTLTIPVECAGSHFTLHASLYPQVLGERRVGFRSVLWGEGAAGVPLTFGDAIQVDAKDAVVDLPPPPAPPAWRVGPLLYMEGAHPRWGAAVSYNRPGSRVGVLGVAMQDRVSIGISLNF